MQITELLRALEPGQVAWVPVAGVSLWPLLRTADQVRLCRASERALAQGDLALLARPDGQLICHLVASTTPLRTASSAGVEDPPGLEVLGRVDAVRRSGVRVPLPTASRPAVRLAVAAWRGVRGNGLLRATREAARWAVVHPALATVRRVVLAPELVRLGDADAGALARLLGDAGRALEAVAPEVASAPVRWGVRSEAGRLLGCGCVTARGVATALHLELSLQALGLEAALVATLLEDAERLGLRVCAAHARAPAFREALEARGFARQEGERLTRSP